MNRLKLNARWTDDCSGKKDFDGDIVSVSTRYWPMGGGFYISDDQGFRKSSDPNIKPSAYSSIVIRFADGTPTDDYGDTLTVAAKNFTGEAFEEVSAAVELWAQAAYARVVAAVRGAFDDSDVEEQA
jgi:hypothetical protein